MVLATSALLTDVSKKEVVLVKVLYIHYPLYLQKDINKVQALLDLSHEVNAITSAYALKLGF